MINLEKYSVVYLLDISKTGINNILLGSNVSFVFNSENIGGITTIETAKKVYDELIKFLSKEELLIFVKYFSKSEIITENTTSEIYYKNSLDIPTGSTPEIKGAGEMFSAGVSANIFSLFKDSLKK